MAALDLSIDIPPEDLAAIQTLPRQVETLVATTRQGLDAILSGTQSDNALSELLGDLPEVAALAGELPDLEGIIAPLRQVVDDLPVDLTDTRAIEAAIDEVISLFGPLVEEVRQGGIDAGLQNALAKAVEGLGRLLTSNDEISTVTRELEQFFSLFRQLLAWEATTPAPDEVAALLARSLIGIAPDLLAAPAAALDGLFAPLDDLLPGGADLAAWRGAGTQLQGFWQGVAARVEISPIDWPGLELELMRGRTALLSLVAARDRLGANTVARIGQARWTGLEEVTGALARLPRVQPQQLTPIFDGLIRTMQGMIAELDELTFTPEEVRLAIREVVRGMLAAIDETPLGEVRRLLIEFQQRVMRGVEGLPLAALAHEAQLALRRVADSLTLIDPDAIRAPIRRFFDEISQRLDALALDAVGEAVQQAWASVSDALNSVAEQLQTLRTRIEGLVVQLQGLVESAAPTLAQIGQQVDTIKGVLDNFSLDPATQVVVGELHDLRDQVAAIDLSDLPAVAVDGIKVAAEALREIDITAAVNDPLDEVFAEIDPRPLMEQASARLRGALAPLQEIDPAKLIGRLDAPVDDLLASLGKFGPDALRALIDQALAPLKEAIHQIDFSALIQPLVRLYAELLAKVDALLNPDRLFQPLEALFQPIVELVDEVNPARLLDRLTPHAGALAEAAGSNAAPPAAIGSQAGILRQNLPSPVDSTDELFGFRPGDLLVPLIDLHHKLMAVFDGIDDAVLAQAARLLRQITVGRLHALDPDAIVARLDSALGTARAEFDTGALFDRLSAALDGYHAAVAKIAAASVNLSSEDAAVAARINILLPEVDPLRLLPDLDLQDALYRGALRLHDELDLSNLRGVFGEVEEELGALIPAPLATLEETSAGLRAALQALDPAPVRVQINELFDQMGAKLVEVSEIFEVALDEIGLAVEEFFLPLNPAGLVNLAGQLHAAAKAQLLALSPAAFKDEVQLIFDVVKEQLDVLNPAFLVEEMGTLRDEVLARLDHLVDDLLPDAAPFHALQAELAEFKPSEILASLATSLEPFSDLVQELDPSSLLEPLIAAIAAVREQVPEAIATIEAAFDEVLAAFPEGGTDRVSASATLG